MSDKSRVYSRVTEVFSDMFAPDIDYFTHWPVAQFDVLVVKKMFLDYCT